MPRFTNEQLIQVLEKATRRINRTLYLTGTDEELSVDASGNVYPSGNDLHDLVLLQAECMILNIDINSDFNGDGNSSSSGWGRMVKDGEQMLDDRGEAASRANARTNYLNSQHNPCAELEKAIKLEKLRRMDSMLDVW